MLNPNLQYSIISFKVNLTVRICFQFNKSVPDYLISKVMVNDSKATIPVFTSHLFNVDEADHR